jgi:phosphoribosylanthranilate isomerase
VAGGIRPGNVRAALAATGADGIDVASGVEARPGVKDSGLLAQLFAEVGDGAMEERA